MKQSQALDILKMGYNVFLTGSAGSGKTYVLHKYINYLKSKKINVGVTASTGIAATHLGGTTIHSWSGLGIRDKLDSQDIQDLLKKYYLRKHFIRSDVLIIDEISMLHAHQLDLINHLAQAFRQSIQPFGGMQVVLSGDFFQLPPVTQGNDLSKFVTESEIWSNMDLKICYLKEQFRQEDNQFLNILNEIRSNQVSDASLRLLLGRLNQTLEKKLEPTKLYTHNINVDAINLRELAKIPGAVKSYNMQSSGSQPLAEILARGCLAPEQLLLKVGAKVMFVKNNFDEGYVNGTIGKIIDFNQEKMPVVRTEDGDEITAYPVEWAIEEEGKTKAAIRQIPLRLAWAITVHKSQGLSLDSAEVDLSKSFVPGMGYVALSRVRTLSGLALKGLNDLALVVDQNVLSHDRELQSLSSKSIKELQDLAFAEKIKKQKLFIGEKITSSAKKRSAQKGAGRIKTKELIAQKLSIPAIAAKRNLKPATIFTHIEKLLAEEKDIDITYLLPPKADYKKIKSAFDYCSYDLLRPVFDYLNEEYSFDILRLVRAWETRKK